MSSNVNVFKMLAYLRLFDKTMGNVGKTADHAADFMNKLTTGISTGYKQAWKNEEWISRKRAKIISAMKIPGAEVRGKSGAIYRAGHTRGDDIFRLGKKKVLDNVVGKDVGAQSRPWADILSDAKYAWNPNKQQLGSFKSVHGGGFDSDTKAMQMYYKAQSKMQSFDPAMALGQRMGRAKADYTLWKNQMGLKMDTIMSIPFKKATPKQTFQQAGISALGSLRELGGVTKVGAKALALPFKAMKGIKAGAAKGLGMAFSAISAMPGGGVALAMILDLLMQLLTALNPFKDIVTALVDIFGIYGDILGQAFIPLIEKLYEVMLSPEVLALVQQISDAMLRMVMAFLPIMDIMLPILIIFISMIANIADAFAPLVETLMPLFIGIMVVLAYAIWIVANAIIFIINAILIQINLLFAFINLFLPKDRAIGAVPLVALVPAPQIALASGGIVTSATRALIGESGPEAVVPLEKMNMFNNNDDMIQILRNIEDSLKNINDKMSNRSLF